MTEMELQSSSEEEMEDEENEVEEDEQEGDDAEDLDTDEEVCYISNIIGWFSRFLLFIHRCTLKQADNSKCLDF
jgi:hypothetical protein